MKIAVIGKGRVGSVLGPAFAQAGHDVRYGLRKPDDAKHDIRDGIARLTTREAVEWAEVMILSVDWPAVEGALADCGPMAGKVLIDCTNPLNYGPNGELSLAMGFDTSGGEWVSARTDARVVKTLNHVGSSVMAIAKTYPQRPIQFVAGEDADAKAIASGLLRDIGFDPRDHGGIQGARTLEPLAMVWIDQAYVHGMDPSSAWLLMKAEQNG
jgi:hypothetical protein